MIKATLYNRPNGVTEEIDFENVLPEDVEFYTTNRLSIEQVDVNRVALTVQPFEMVNDSSFEVVSVVDITKVDAIDALHSLRIAAEIKTKLMLDDLKKRDGNLIDNINQFVHEKYRSLFIDLASV